jgi:putative DNA methylase
MHKWWAKRLGSVFRGILLGCLLPEKVDLEKAFYRKHDFSGIAVFDPFMGSGTTVGEAHKLGCAALGRDINPIACESVRVALGPLDRQRLLNAFTHLSETVGQRIRGLYQSADENGQPCEVLYYFWVKQAPCSQCGASVDLFPMRVIARNAYPDRKPEVQVCCPGCGDIFAARSKDHRIQCRVCQLVFDPQAGNVSGAKAVCPSCSGEFPIAEAVRASAKPPTHRLYGKLLLTPQGDKRYLAATKADAVAYQQCSTLLQRELNHGTMRLPALALADGFNTRQAMGYNYLAWRDFFNDRQLLALGWLQEAIAQIGAVSAREALLTLFSGVLEFNNLFASYKGEGTGAVRHMFSHHILKPERLPIEANVWGTPRSSGSFSTLFETRLMRALNYRTAPFEVTVIGSGKAHSSAPFSGAVSLDWPTETPYLARSIYLSCGSSDETGLTDKSVDLIVTDPPFFDNVHYSELADFFYAWQSLYPRGFLANSTTTRHAREVQDSDAERFADKLCAVFAECHRVLKDEGMMVFTYHHSRAEGWASLIKALWRSGFAVINAHPVKAELSVAAPKSQAKEPIQLDVIIVCRKKEEDTRPALKPEHILAMAASQARQKASRLASVGVRLSYNDRRVISISQFIAALGPAISVDEAVKALLERQADLDWLADDFAAQVEGSIMEQQIKAKLQDQPTLPW